MSSLEKSILYDNVKDEHRIKVFDIDYDEEVINTIEQRVLDCREYLETIKKSHNMEKQKTIYCGSGRKMGADWLSVTLCLDKAKDHFFEYNGNTYVKLNVNIKPERDQYDKGCFFECKHIQTSCRENRGYRRFRFTILVPRMTYANTNSITYLGMRINNTSSS